MGMMLGLYDGPPSASGVLLLDATPYLTALGCSTDERGFEGLAGTIDRTLSEIMRFYNQAGVLYTGLAKNGAIVWEGRLEDPSLRADNQGSGLGIQALGAWRALTDDRYNALWSITAVNEWLVERTEDVASRSEAKWEIDTNNRLYLAQKKNENFANGTDAGGITYETPSGSTRTIVGIQFNYEYKGPVNWKARCNSLNRDYTGGANQWLLNGNGAVQVGAINVSFTGTHRVDFTVVNETGGNVLNAADTGTNYLKITNLRVVTATTNRVNTTFTNNTGAGAATVTPASMANIYVGQRLVIASGNAGNSESVVVTAVTSTTFTATFANAHVIGQTIRAMVIYGDEIVKDIVTQISTLNSGQLSSSTALIQSPGLDLLDEIYEDVIPDSICAHLATLGDNASPPNRWETGVYEGRILFFRPQGDAARTWYVDATDLNMQRTINDLANVTYATYQDAIGRRQATADAGDSASINRYGVSRRANVGADTTSSVQAGVIRDAELQDQKDPKPRAVVRFEAIYDAYGARYPLWLVRSGDTITIRNIPPSLSSSIDRVRTFRVTHTSYNVFADTLDIEPEAPPPTLEVMLAQRAEGIKR